MVRMYLKATDNVEECKNAWEHLRVLVNEISSDPAVDSKTVKAFFSKHGMWAMGQGAPEGFVNLRIAMTPRGKDIEERIVVMLQAKLRELYKDSLESGKATVSVEIREMDPTTFRDST